MNADTCRSKRHNRQKLRKFQFQLLIKGICLPARFVIDRKIHRTNATTVFDSTSKSQSEYFLIVKSLISAVCLRLLQRRNVSGRRNPDKIPRQRDQKAKENFVSNAVTKSVSELMKKPHRDKYSYDKYPPIQFSTPIISALHARIGLPASFPLSTLTRCLTDPSQERDHTLHNEALSQIGAGLLEYYVSEYLCVRWPRLPMPTQLSALWAYTGESALTRIAREWGVESQSLERTPPHKKEGNVKFAWEVKEQARQGWLETRGNAKTGDGMLNNLADKEYENRFVLYAMQRFVQSLVGGVYVHSVLS